LSSIAETIFWYNATSGKDFAYFARGSSFTPAFTMNPGAEDIAIASTLCNVSGTLDQTCAYDYYATGSSVTANATRESSELYVGVQKNLGKPLNFDLTKCGNIQCLKSPWLRTVVIHVYKL